MCVVWLKYKLKEKERMRKIMKTVLATALLVVVMAGQVYAYSSNWRTDSNNNWLYYEMAQRLPTHGYMMMDIGICWMETESCVQVYSVQITVVTISLIL